jgi:hypothetical protein
MWIKDFQGGYINLRLSARLFIVNDAEELPSWLMSADYKGNLTSLRQFNSLPKAQAFLENLLSQMSTGAFLLS